MNKSQVFVVVLILFIAGTWLAVSWLGLGSHPNEYKEFLDQKVIIDGYIVSDPEKYLTYAQRFEVVPQTKYKQKILVTTYIKNSFNYGDKIYMIGILHAPKNNGDYDYIHYLAAKGIYAQMNSSDIFVVGKSKLNSFIFYSLKVKHFVYARFQKYLPKEQSALLIALIVGQKDLMSKNVVDAFTRTGTAHLIAVSGYILTLLLAFAVQTRKHIGKRNALVFSGAIAFVYIVMANFAAGVVRAAIMSAILVLSKSTGKQYQVMPALVLTAATLIAINPLIVKYDIGFALSFISIIGVVYFAPALEAVARTAIPKLPKKSLTLTIICTTLAAQLITDPLTIYYFKQISLIAPVANLAVVPIIEPLLVIGYFLCVPLIAWPVGKLLLVPLNYILLVVGGLSKLPFASAPAGITANQMVLIYVAEAAIFLLIYQSKAIKNRL